MASKTVLSPGTPETIRDRITRYNGLDKCLNDLFVVLVSSSVRYFLRRAESSSRNRIRISHHEAAPEVRAMSLVQRRRIARDENQIVFRDIGAVSDQSGAQGVGRRRDTRYLARFGS